ncbi:MAG TPA: Spy/CpxP family protein refolding chaperone [Vicinamibacterales bacterium]|nr:Spy/CpxP family protein refolding chaperone [Vicinamibacterales bacterium]HOQ61756.1 Spy/CpxP family protein refolding chaperone [Vicinamibacterales bacterium]
MCIGNRLAWIGLVLLLAPAAADAQGFKWWQSDRFKAELALTPDQTARIEDVFQRLLPTLVAGKDALDRLESRLSAVIAEGTAPEADVMRLVDQVEQARSDLTKARTLMLYRMHQVLTPEQRAKMNALHAKREQERRQTRRPPQPEK